MVTISRSVAVRIFQGLGLHSADGWNRKKMQDKLDKIHNIVPDLTKIGDEELDPILDRLIAARENGEPIELISDKQATERAVDTPEPAADREAEAEDSGGEEDPAEVIEEMPDGGPVPEDETVPVKPRKPKQSKSKKSSAKSGKPAEEVGGELLTMEVGGLKAQGRRSGPRGMILLAGSEVAAKVDPDSPKYVGKFRKQHADKLEKKNGRLILSEDAKVDALVAASGFVRGGRGSSKDWK